MHEPRVSDNQSIVERLRDLHDRIRADAEEHGVFGVPNFVLDGEPFWGREHLALIRLRVVELGLARADPGYPLESSHAWRPRNGDRETAQTTT